jgi:hypothetical protein
MSLANKAAEALAHQGPVGWGGATLSVETTGGRLECNLVALDSLACGFTRFCLEVDSLANASIDDIQRISEALSQKLTYLLEPISSVEINSEACVVQMRSKPPRRDDDQSTYYELLVKRGGMIQLVRYRKPRGAAREIIPAHVTREVWQKLAGDFAAAAGLS